MTIERGNELLKKWKNQNKHLSIDEKLELRELLENHAQKLEDNGDHWGSLVTIGILVQIK